MTRTGICRFSQARTPAKVSSLVKRKEGIRRVVSRSSREPPTMRRTVLTSLCSIHVHVDASPHNVKTLRNIVNIMASKEDLLYKALDVQVHREHYCKKADTRFLDEMNHKRPRSMDELESIWYNGRGGRWQHYDDTRYHGLNLHSVFSKGTIEFRLFNSTLHAGKVKTYIQLCLAISNQALHQKGASRSKTQSPNEKYTFRTWLLRLGMIGDEFKTARGFLLEKLEGNIAWRDPAQAEAQKERFAARRLAEQEAPTEEEPSDAVQDDDTDQDEEPAIRITM